SSFTVLPGTSTESRPPVSCWSWPGIQTVAMGVLYEIGRRACGTDGVPGARRTELQGAPAAPGLISWVPAFAGMTADAVTLAGMTGVPASCYYAAARFFSRIFLSTRAGDIGRESMRTPMAR